MNIWMVIYVGTQIGGTVGPVPYDMKECVFKATLFNIENFRQIETGKDANGDQITPLQKIMRFKCEASDTRPVITFGKGDVT